MDKSMTFYEYLKSQPRNVAVDLVGEEMADGIFDGEVEQEQFSERLFQSDGE